MYIIGGKEVSIKEITKDQLLFIETYENRTLYNGFRNRILEEKGDDVKCTIRITIPEMELEAIDGYNVILS